MVQQDAHSKFRAVLKTGLRRQKHPENSKLPLLKFDDHFFHLNMEGSLQGSLITLFFKSSHFDRSNNRAKQRELLFIARQVFMTAASGHNYLV